ncbi:hypothetical protein [Mesorhizobium sp.]|nr:hypothetical protein [Mesorhizobium sp.]
MCNRGRRGRGVQVEIPRTLRDSLTADSQALATFATAIRAGIL